MNNLAKATIVVTALIAVLVYGLGSSQQSKPHWMLTKFNWDIKVKTKGGHESRTPFLVHSSETAIILGTCSSDFVKNALKDQDVHPVLTENGDGILALWLVSYVNTTTGPYHEFVATIVASATPSVVQNEPLQLLNAFVFDPQNVVYIYKLWLSDPLPIDYGRSFLGTDKHPMTVKDAGRQDSVHVYESFDASGTRLVSASLSTHIGLFEQLSVSFGMINTVGFRASLEAMLAPTLYNIVCPKNITPEIDGNPRSLIYGYSPDVSVAEWDPASDKLELGKALREIKFEPKLKQFARDYAFVYFPPFKFFSF